MSTPDYPDWNQPVTTRFQSATLFAASLASGDSTPTFDVSQYESVIVFANASWFVLDFTLDTAGTQLVQETRLNGAGAPQVITAPYMSLTNSGSFRANVTVIAFTRLIRPQDVADGYGTGWRGNTGSTAMVANNQYGLFTVNGVLPSGLCSAWIQLGSGTTVRGILIASQFDGTAVQLWDTNLLVVTSGTPGATDQRLLAIPPGTDNLTFLCTTAGTSNVTVALVPAV